METAGALTTGSEQTFHAATNPFLRLVSNAEIEAQRQSELVQQAPMMLSLAAEVQNAWERNKRAKHDIEEQILKDYRQCNAEYDPETLAEIHEQGGSKIFINLTGIKQYSLQAWLEDLIFPADDRPWDMEATPVADLPPDMEQKVAEAVMAEVQQAFARAGAMPLPEDIAARADEIRENVRAKLQQQAEKIAEKMATQIEDDLVQGEWEQAVKECLYDFSATVAGIVHGPIYKRKAAMKWKQMPEGWQPVDSEEVRQTFSRVSPLDIYPSPDASSVDDGDLIHHMRLRPHDLEAMIGSEGFDEASIRTALNTYQTGGLHHWLAIDQERNNFEQKPNYWEATPGTIDVLSYWGYQSGTVLMNWGYPELLDPNKSYHVNAWLVGRWVIGVRIIKPGQKRPYNVASLEEIPGAFWGHGLAWRIRAPQQMCNALARAMSNNGGFASGPITVYNDTSRFTANMKVEHPYPWQIMQFGPDKGSTSHRPPVEFYTTPFVSDRLLVLYQHFSQLADEISGVPAYAYGNSDVGGAGSTASGLSMLMSHASRGIKKAVMNIDRGIVRRSIEGVYVNTMLYHPDSSIKGDLNAIARGATALIAKEQKQVRLNEFMQSTANPMDFQIMGIPGRAQLLRESIKSLDMPVDDIVPDPESLEVQANQAQVQNAVQQTVQNIAQALGVNPQALMQAANGPQQGAPQQGGPAATDPSGRLVSGQETRLFN